MTQDWEAIVISIVHGELEARRKDGWYQQAVE